MHYNARIERLRRKVKAMDDIKCNKPSTMFCFKEGCQGCPHEVVGETEKLAQSDSNDLLLAAVEKWASSPEGQRDMETASAEAAETCRKLREERRIDPRVLQMPLGPHNH